MTLAAATASAATATGLTASATTAKPAASTSALGSLAGNFQDFLTMLMTQLKHQDPTTPLDPNQFTSELVQFSSVEQQISTNASLGQLIQLTQGGEILQSSSLVGKPVTVASDHIALQGGKGTVQFDTTTSQSVSIGAATHSPERTVESADELLAIADAALYRAKGAGRNCVVLA